MPWSESAQPRSRWRVGRAVVTVLVAVLLLVVVLIPLGALVDDVRIDDDGATAVADVTDVSRGRVAVTFLLEDGRGFSPKVGVFYTSGLEKGDRVVVEYDRDEPDRVRVKGGSWRLSLLPAASLLWTVGPVLAIAWAILGRLESGERRRGRRRGPAVPAPAPGAPGIRQRAPRM